MKIVLRLVDIDGQQIHEVDSPLVPDANDYVTFETRPGEWITRLVSARRGIRFDGERVIVELELTSLEDDEET